MCIAGAVPITWNYGVTGTGCTAGIAGSDTKTLNA